MMLYEFMRSSQKLCQKNHNFGFKLQSIYIYNVQYIYIYTIIWWCVFFAQMMVFTVYQVAMADGQVLWADCTTATSMELRVLRLTLNRSMRATPPASVMRIHGADWFLGSFLAHPKQERDENRLKLGCTLLDRGWCYNLVGGFKGQLWDKLWSRWDKQVSPLFRAGNVWSFFNIMIIL
jgi:hypothetical protein